MKSSRRLIVYLFSSVGCTALIVFGVLNYFAGNTTAGILEVSLAIVGILNALFLYFTKNTDMAATVVLGIMVTVLSFLTLNGGFASSGVFWFFAFPPLAFYMRPVRQGIAWSLLLIGIVVIIFATGHSFYSLETLMQLGASFATVTLFIYFYAVANRRATRQLREQAANVEKLNKELSEKLSKQEAFDTTIATQNKELEETKQAMLNILEDLQEEKSRDEAILASIGEGLLVTDDEGKVTMINKEFENILEWSRSEVIGQKFTDVVPMLDEHKKEIPVTDRTLHKALSQKEALHPSETLYYKRKDGSLFPVTVTVSPIYVNSEVVGAVEVFRDITHEKAIDKAKTEFVSLASHQLRTPLSAIKWYTELLLSGDFGKVTEEQKNYLQEIEKGNERMIALVGSLLDISRLELGTFNKEVETIHVPDLITSILDEHTVLAKEKSITITSNLAEDVPSVEADRKQLRIVFENLVSNAIKYTPENGAVTVTLTNKNDGAHPHVLYSVKDTGIGIPQEQQQRIFEKLFRADNAVKGDTDGTGLGLYLVKLILEELGGEIWFESKEKEGTEFFIKLPTQLKQPAK